MRGITLQLLKQTVEEGHQDITEMLINQYEQYEIYHSEVRENLATIKSLVQRIVESNQPLYQSQQDRSRLEKFVSKFSEVISKVEDGKIKDINIRSDEMLLNLEIGRSQKKYFLRVF